MRTAVRVARWALWAWPLFSAAVAHAGCSRAIDAPMSPIGMSVSFDGERSAGIFPTLLRELGASIGCEFRMQRVPRARLQRMFESRQADLLLPASASPSRNADGEFVPLIQVRASLLTLSSGKALPHSLAALVGQRGFKVAVVRGFSFGAAYDRALNTLRGQGRLVEEADTAGVARALRLGLAQGTVMTANIFIGTLLREPDLAPLVPQVHSQALDELGWSESGVYLSRHTLGEADRRVLRAAFTQAARSGRVWRLFLDSYPAGSLSDNVRPL
ncbi:MAG: transporter substrate-binding domain-containing protein [Rubrivivax sp.]|nr:MAG: transporter substrate-binding domain-containing protein [Rubrivivax sp.]